MAAPIRGEEPSAIRVGSNNASSLGCIALSSKYLQHIIDNLMLKMLRYVDATPECCIVFHGITRKQLKWFSVTVPRAYRRRAARGLPLLFERFFRVS